MGYADAGIVDATPIDLICMVMILRLAFCQPDHSC